MKKLSLLLPVLILFLLSPPLSAEVRHEINFPDLEEYQTITCDLHMHTVFSDGQVWPTVRVTEAWRQGLDAISITDHIEYQPHKDDLLTNHNRPYDLAWGAAKTHGLLLAKGAEITRDTPPGHFNAIFLDDIDPLDTENFLEAIKRANDQGLSSSGITTSGKDRREGDGWMSTRRCSIRSGFTAWRSPMAVRIIRTPTIGA